MNDQDLIPRMGFGTFDRTGLPDPLIMTFRVVGDRGRISGLTCRLGAGG